MQAPKNIPTIRKKLNEVPAWPLYSSSTSFGANPKHNVVPIPLVEAKRAILIINRILVTLRFQWKLTRQKWLKTKVNNKKLLPNITIIFNFLEGLTLATRYLPIVSKTLYIRIIVFEL